MSRGRGSPAISVGHKKTGGRVAGTPNKLTVDLAIRLDELGFDPLARLVQCHEEALKAYLENRDGDVRMTGAPQYLKIATDAAADMMQYRYPKRKAIEVEAGDKIRATIADLAKAWADERGSKGA